MEENKDGMKIIILDKNISLSELNNIKYIRIKDKKYNLLIMKDYWPILGEIDGTVIIEGEEETIFENRMRHIKHLNSMGAQIVLFDKKAIIKGKQELKGKEVVATDLRAGAAMLVAGMIADGTTIITNIEHILRVYENIVGKLSQVGAIIKIEEI